MRFMMDAVLQGRADGRPEQGAVHVRVLQRGPGPHPPAAAGSREARARSERLVRQRRADRVRADRPRDGDLRQQHLQVLRRVSPHQRGTQPPERR